MVGNVASRLLGLVREQVMAWLFGATGATDAFVAASAVPTMVYDLLVGGAISAALVPVFVDAAEDRERLWKLVSAILNLAALLLIAVATVLALLADSLIDLLGAGFEPWQHLQAVGMVRVMLVAVILQGLAGVLMAVLYARQQVAWPAFAPAVYNGAIILLALLFHLSLGVNALVAGVLLGAGGQLLLQLAGLRDLRYRPVLDLALPEVRTILRLYAPVAAGMVVTIVGITIDRYLASQLEAGSMTVMSYATRLIQFPLGLVATATSFAVLPTLAKHASGMLGPAVESETEGFPNSRDNRLTCESRVPESVSVPADARILPISSGTARSARRTAPVMSPGSTPVRLRRKGLEDRLNHSRASTSRYTASYPSTIALGWNRATASARHPSGDSSPTLAAASAMASIPETRNPVSPSVTTSGTAPIGSAITGVPHASASTIARPNGSGSRTGNSSARAPARSSALRSFETSPSKITVSASTCGRMRSSKNHASFGCTRPASTSGIPARFATSMARSCPLRSHTRPRHSR